MLHSSAPETDAVILHHPTDITGQGTAA